MSDQETKVADATKVEEPTADVEVTAAAENGTTESTKPEADAETSKPEDAAAEETKDEATKAEETKAEETKDEETKDEDKPTGIRNPPKNMLRVKRPDRNDAKEKANKFDATVLKDSSDPKEIREQIHFYFSDSNLPTDKFMSQLTGLTENKPVPLATICSFKRMRRFKPYSAVVAALKDSNELVVEGEEGAETLRRKKPFDPSKRVKIDERTVYVKGFGKEEPSTQFDIEAFFAQFGEFNSVRLRRGETGDAKGGFKGSVWVEWADQETADKFMALDPKPQWKEHDLLILWKQDYIKEKNEMLREGDGELSRSHKGARGGRGNFRGRGNRRDGGDNWKDRRDRDQKNGHRDQRGRGRGRGRGNRGRGGRDNGDRNSENNAKRSREDDGQDAPPAKKVDNKEGAAAETA